MFTGTGQAATVDFSTLAPGAVTDFAFGGGITGTLSAVVFPSRDATDAVVINTNVAQPQDPDLESPFSDANGVLPSRNFGNALIVQEPGSVLGDDQAAPGGQLVFTFDRAVDLDSIVILDAEEGGQVRITGVPGGAGLLTGIPSGVSGDNEFQFLTTPNGQGLNAFTVLFNGSGAVGELDISVVPVPLPASLPLLAFGLGAIGFMRKRRKAA